MIEFVSLISDLAVLIYIAWRVHKESRETTKVKPKRKSYSKNVPSGSGTVTSIVYNPSKDVDLVMKGGVIDPYD